MDCRHYLRFIMLAFVVPGAMGRVLKNGNCLHSIDETLLEETYNQTAQICCTKSGVHDKYDLGQEVKCCGETTYKPKIEFCSEEKVYKRFCFEGKGIGNNSHETSVADKSIPKNMLEKHVDSTIRVDLSQHTRKHNHMDLKFKRLMKQRGRKLLRELLMYINLSKVNIYSQS